MATEKRLIDANAIKYSTISHGGWGQPEKIVHDYEINRMPTVDAVEVVHGRWIDTGETYEDEKCRYNYWECSECNNQIAGRYGLYYYCPNCGAKMMDGDGNG